MNLRAFALRVLPTLVALAGVVALVPVKTALNDFVGGDVGLVPGLMVVILGAYLGFVPGLVATAAVVLVEMVVFLEPRHALGVSDDIDRLRLAMTGIAGLLASWLAWFRSRAERQARTATVAASDARDRVELVLRRVAALQELASALGGAVTTDQIAAALAAKAAEAVIADGVTVYLPEPGGEGLRAAASHGTPDEGALAPVPLAPDAGVPATEVARTGESVYVEHPADAVARYGATIARLGMPARATARAVVPMDVEGQRFGVLAIAWERAHELGPDRREFVESIARIGAAAFERARLLDAERRARQRAEDVRRHLDLLAEAGRVLGLSLEYEDTLRRVTGLAVPLLGDVGIVDVIEADGVRRLTATADPELSAAANLLETFPLDLAAGGPVAQVLEEGRARVFEIDDPLVESVARTADHAVALGTIGARWLLTIPLVAQGRTIGALTFLRRDERPYDFETIATAEELGDRAGRALENARLHRQVARLAEREQRHAGELEAVVGAIGEGILVSDPGGEVRSSNASATRILGGAVTSMDDVLDRLLDASGGRPAALAPGPVEYRLANRPTSWVEMATYVVPAADGLDAPSSVIVCRDVTAFRQGQALREAFLGLLSHELRTPVTTIYGGSSVLTRPGARIARQTQADILEDIAGEADRLYRLVEDLMVLARFDEGIELGSDPILLQHLVPAVAEQEAVRWPALRVVSDVQPDLPMVRGDETSITQVVRNLLSNAAKYSEAGSEIRVVVASVPEGVAVRVLDRGPGIDPDEVEHLFDPFYRSPATAKMAGGAGIGLYVSRRLVDAMGGRIEAAPRPDGGSEFSVVLPLYGFDGDDA